MKREKNRVYRLLIDENNVPIIIERDRVIEMMIRRLDSLDEKLECQLDEIESDLDYIKNRIKIDF